MDCRGDLTHRFVSRRLAHLNVLIISPRTFVGVEFMCVNLHRGFGEDCAFLRRARILNQKLSEVSTQAVRHTD